MRHFIVFSLAALLLTACSGQPEKKYKLGELTFAVTGNEAAKPAFEKGYLLLHSFEYMDAAEAFVEAQTLDPDFAMAYWGEAMSYNHSIWQEQDLEKARAALQKLGTTPAERSEKAATPLEKDLFAAIEILYGEGTKTARDKAYSTFLGELHRKYPGNHEVASWYALSLLAAVPVGRNDEVYQASARISGQILRENPNHPGALHYFIHANDDPVHARKALFAANDYAQVAPDAAHALHMPTHIYVAAGMWDQVVSSNEQSWQASVNRRQLKNLPTDALGFHSFHWLQYGYLQQGRREGAEQMLADMVAYRREFPSPRARAHEVFLKSTYLAETGDWQSRWTDTLTDTRGLNISTRSMEFFVAGMKHYARNDAASLESVLTQLASDRKREQALITSDGIALCGSGGASRQNATQLDIDMAAVMETQLKAYHAWLNGDPVAAEKWMQTAATSEDGLSYAYGPPVIVKPPHEMYGEFLLAQNRPEEALKQFDQALQRAPKRRLSLQGKLAAARMLGDTALENQLGKELEEISKHQHLPVPAVVAKV